MIYLFNCHYLKFILGGIKSTYDSDLQHAKFLLGISYANTQHYLP